MSYVGGNFFHKVEVGLALETQGVGSGGTITGAAIKEPWRKCRQLSFLLVGGDHGTAATATCVVQGQKRSDDAWEALKENDGATDLQFTASDLGDGAALEDGVLLGTIDLSTVDSETYKAVRLLYTRGAQAVECEVGGAYILSDFYRMPSGQVDNLFDKTRP